MISWEWCCKYLFTVDFIVTLIIIIVILYFIFTKRKSKNKKSTKGFRIPKFPNVTSVKVSKKRKVNKGEEISRNVFQKIFNCKFISIRPSWLKNPVTGKNLELDGYASDVLTPIGKGLAFEYDGEQHSKYTPHFHKGGPDEFIYQTKKDSWKDMKCKEKGILLIRIPYYIVHHDIERYVKQELFRHKVYIPMRSPESVHEKFEKGDGIYD